MSEAQAPSFVDLGIDPVKGAEVYKTLNLDEGLLSDPVQVSKIQEISKFANRLEEPGIFIRKMLRRNNSSMANLDFMASYVDLNTQLSGLNQEYMYAETADDKIKIKKMIKEINKELKYYD